MGTRPLTQFVCITLAALSTSACTAEPASLDWPIECVGRMSIRLPGAVDVPGMTAEQFLTNSQSRSYKFSDGQDAFHARFQYGGNLAITAPLGAEQIDRLVKKQRQRFSTVQTAVEKGELRAGSGAKLNLSKLDRADPAFGWRIFNETEVTLVAYPTIPGHGLAWILSGLVEQSKKIDSAFESFRAGVRARPVFSVPSENGVCMPHLFVRDNGSDSAGRHIAATYRLRAHPDVTIMLEDASAAGVPGHGDPKKYSAIYKSNFFGLKNTDRQLNHSTVS